MKQVIQTAGIYSVEITAAENPDEVFLTLRAKPEHLDTPNVAELVSLDALQKAISLFVSEALATEIVESRDARAEYSDALHKLKWD